jgi:hypothetical protein
VRWPWPRRSERKAAVRAARAKAERSQAEARKARKLAAELRAMAGDGFAQVVAEGLMRSEEPKS